MTFVINFVDYFRMPISAPDFVVRLVDTGLPVHFVQSPLNLIPSQLYSIAMVIAGAVFLVVASKRPQKPVILEALSPPEQREESESQQPSRRLRKKLRKG